MIETIHEKSGYGRSLQKARNVAGLSQETVAEKLRLDPKLVEAIEQEDLTGLPAPAYVRGYIRSYAQLVDCDVENIVEQYNLSANNDPKLTHSVPVEPYHQQSRKPVAIWAVLAVILTSLVLTLILVVDIPKLITTQTSDATSEQQEFEPNIISEQEAAMAEFVKEEGVSAEGQASVGGFSEAEGVGSEFVGAPALVAESPEATSQEALKSTATITKLEESEATFDISAMPDRQDVVLEAPYGDDQLTFNFAGDCWVEAVDANGFRLLFGLFNQSEQALTVKGQAPFQIILGNAHFVNVAVNEKPFELTPYIRSNNAARVLITESAEHYQN